MKSVLQKGLSLLLCMAMLVSLCAVGIGTATPAAAAATNVAFGKSVAFAYGTEAVAGDANYGVDAIKAGLTALTDGVADSPNWWVNNGNPYVALKNSVVTGPYIFSVDLGSSYVTEQVSCTVTAVPTGTSPLWMGSPSPSRRTAAAGPRWARCLWQMPR